MALIVEDGSGRPAAESFVSVEWADAYHAARGNAEWAALDEATKEAKLRVASEFLADAYSGRWTGAQLTAAQALPWPRASVMLNGHAWPENELPNALKRATAEMALRAISGPLLGDVEGSAMVTEETVGPITTKYAAGTAQSARSYPAIDAMLAGLLWSAAGDGGFGMIRVDYA